MNKDQIARCKVCDVGYLSHAKIKKFGEAMALLGFTVYSIGLLMIASYVLFTWLGFPLPTVIQEDPKWSILLGGVPYGLLSYAMVSVLIGLFLASKRRVLRCSHCGAVIDAS